MSIGITEQHEITIQHHKRKIADMEILLGQTKEALLDALKQIKQLNDVILKQQNEINGINELIASYGIC